jgi:hypothetical protein
MGTGLGERVAPVKPNVRPAHASSLRADWAALCRAATVVATVAATVVLAAVPAGGAHAEDLLVTAGVAAAQPGHAQGEPNPRLVRLDALFRAIAARPAPAAAEGTRFIDAGGLFFETEGIPATAQPQARHELRATALHLTRTPYAFVGLTAADLALGADELNRLASATDLPLGSHTLRWPPGFDRSGTVRVGGVTVEVVALGPMSNGELVRADDLPGLGRQDPTPIAGEPADPRTAFQRGAKRAAASGAAAIVVLAPDTEAVESIRQLLDNQMWDGISTGLPVIAFSQAKTASVCTNGALWAVRIPDGARGFARIRLERGQPLTAPSLELVQLDGTPATCTAEAQPTGPAKKAPAKRTTKPKARSGSRSSR